MSTVYLQTHCTDPAYNLAFEEYVLKCRTRGDYLILWQNDNAVIVGRNQNAEAEINRAFIDEHNIRVVRRNTGGGAVYHDLGNLNYSFITDADQPDRRSAEKFTKPIVQALQQLGLDAQSSGRNDILVDGKKVSGTAQQLLNGRILHHGTLLFDSDSAKIAGALNPDPEKFRYKGVSSVQSRVGNIRSALQQDMTIFEFWAYLEKALTRHDFVADALEESELEQVDILKTGKYDTYDWNFGKSPRYDIRCRRRWDAGTLEIQLTVDKGRIAQIGILGDFLALCDITPLENALVGCIYREEEIAPILNRFPTDAYLGGITPAEFLTTMMNK